MSDTVLNTYLTSGGIQFPYTRRIIGLKQTVIEAANGVNQIVTHTSTDRMRFTLNLRDYSRTLREALLGFYLTLPGRQDTFLFKDEMNYAVSRLTIGTGDGVEDDFQLIQTYGSTSYNRKNIIDGSQTVYVADAAKTEGVDYSLDDTDSGIVHFLAGKIPTAGQAIEAAFQFYRRCRFVTEWEDIERYYDGADIALVFDEVLVA